MVNEVRSYAVALYLMARGHRPTGAQLIHGTPIFQFAVEAEADLLQYKADKATLDVLAYSLQTRRPA